MSLAFEFLWNICHWTISKRKLQNTVETIILFLYCIYRVLYFFSNHLLFSLGLSHSWGFRKLGVKQTTITYTCSCKNNTDGMLNYAESILPFIYLCLSCLDCLWNICHWTVNKRIKRTVHIECWSLLDIWIPVYQY